MQSVRIYPKHFIRSVFDYIISERRLKIKEFTKIDTNKEKIKICKVLVKSKLPITGL